MTVKPKILIAQPSAELCWSAGVPGIIGGEHTFTLTPADGGTQLLQTETFRGILVPVSGKTLAAAEASYQKLNEALNSTSRLGSTTLNTDPQHAQADASLKSPHLSAQWKTRLQETAGQAKSRY